MNRPMFDWDQNRIPFGASSLTRRFDRAFRRFAIIVLRIYGRLVLGIRYHGTLPKELLQGGVLTVCNHVHYVDSCMISCFCPTRTFYYPTLQANFEIPFVRHLLKHLYAIPIPQSPKQLSRFGSIVRQLLGSGQAVHFFPEGSLNPYCCKLRPFQRGVFCYAYDCQVPIVPFVITFRNPQGFSARFRRRPYLDLTVLEPLWPRTGVSRKTETERLMNQCYEQMRSQIGPAPSITNMAPCAVS